MPERRTPKPKTGAKAPAKAPAKSKSAKRADPAEDAPESPRAAAKRLGRLLAGCEEAFDLLMTDAWETERTGDFRESLLAAARVAKAAAALGLAMNRLAGESRHRIVFERGASGPGASGPGASDPGGSEPARPSLEDTRPAAVLLPAPPPDLAPRGPGTPPKTRR